ncbi:DUF4112 domain-containing protein [Solimonas sp. K1W22B-7]|uniref:DUF4112 domain-containing protein n=1 Tax=Solimonas sp. K1W22B-7 TaxID=2303331 RepID=UPI000E32E342|nr:DUF4112 domain-containing protein [Solimonas sp. K1W22B-7]AXQ31214.1 DUF4112 domain-containing protein [Solimonas sp. K1W22B-7]
MDTTSNGSLPPLAEVQASRQRLQRMSKLLDEAVSIPGLGWKFGLDSVIGLVPVVGDIAGLALSGFLVYEGVKIGAPRPLLLKMTGFAALDAAVGLVPLLGDVFDFAFKANRINARLLEDYLREQEARHGVVVAGPAQRRVGLLALAALMAAVAALGWWAARHFL